MVGYFDYDEVKRIGCYFIQGLERENWSLIKCKLELIFGFWQ